MSVPNAVMDVWFFDSDDEGANPLDRPKLRMYALGVEYVLKPRPTNWIFYYEYAGSLIEEGYWDDVEEPGEHDDGDWIRADGFGMHSLGANYAHEIALTSEEKNVWLSMMFSAGLGVGFLTGKITQWHPGSNPANTDPNCLSDAPAYQRYQSCPSDGEKRLPGVIPVLDIGASARVNFAERANLRLDVGLHDMFYAGGAVGAVF
jgi:hypothetical protein